MVPQQEATRRQSEQRQQQDESDRDPDRQRQDVAQQGKAHGRQHDAGYDALASGQPGRPTGGQPEPEGQAAGDEG
jgi:hypothetical protein